MDTIKYVPEQAKGKKPIFSGYIEVTQTTFDERMMFVEECNFKMDDSGEMAETSKQIGSIRKAVSLSKQFYKSVHLKHIKDKIEYKTFDDLSYDSECAAVLAEVAGIIARGTRPGKN